MTLELISRGTAVPGRPQLLFLHGGFHDARCWDHHFLPWFAERGWAAHAMSTRGHGQSPGNLAVDQPGMDDFVNDVNEMIARLGSNVVLIGHSLGGVLSQMVRVRNTAAVGTVLLASSPMRPSMGVAWRMLRQHPIALYKAQVKGDFEGGLPAFISFFYGDNLDEDLKATYISQLCGESPRAMHELFKRPPPETPDLDTRPVLVVAGRDDWSIPMADQEWLSTVFQASLRVVTGAHNLMLDPAWEESASTINAWLEERFLAG
ncbi:alpha/beta fold hydrolase [Pyruvatibacter sp. HU-CL02332]|uniref:alpha/beta hydrolase n=1 Tax=Pyruvatibacter sp. HU-CL02332 TaxID=3127650 RepID=UPI003365AC4D